jgi:putative transposase
VQQVVLGWGLRFDGATVDCVARLPRKFLPEEGIFHITARGAGLIAIYIDDIDRRFCLALLAEVVEKFDWTVHALCLMTNHYHLVVEGRRDDLSAGLHVLNGEYAQRFNARHERWGHLFGERFSAWVIRSEEHLHSACLYVFGNAVRAGLCENLGDWPWAASRYAFDP